MAAPQKQAKSLVPLQGEVLRPLIPGGHKPHDLSTIKGIHREMSYIYRRVHTGELAIELATRLSYMLDQMARALKMGNEIDREERAAAVRERDELGVLRQQLIEV